MDNFQKEHITKHLAHLVEYISPSTLFLSILRSHNVLSTADLAELNSIHNEHEKTSRLVRFLVTRPNAYTPLVEALRRTGQTGVASVLEEILPSTSTSNESSSSFNSNIPENEENPGPHGPRTSSFQADHNNNETSFNRNILRFISKSQESDIISLIHSFMNQSLETASIKIIHTLDTFITSYKLTASKDLSVNSVYYPFHEGETFSRNPKQLNIVTLTTTHSLLSLLHDTAHLKNLKAVILTSETLKKIRQTVDDFKNSLNYPPPAITTTTDEIKWTDLTPEGKELLLSKTVKFQETDVRLGDLQDDPKYFENLSSSFIINLLYGGQQPPTLFRKSGKDPPKEYICRQIHPRCSLAVEILNEANSENVFLVSGMSNGALGLKQLTTRIKVGHSSQQLKFSKLTKNLISLDENAHFKEICRRAGTATVFWLEAHEIAKSKICLEFKQAHPENADLRLIQNWADKRTGMKYGIAEESFLGGILTSRKPVCIADVPGMGKSALLFKAIERIKQKFPTRFVHYSTMPDFMKNVELVMARRGIEGETIQREQIIEAISEAASDITFERNLLRKLLEPLNESVRNENHIRCELMLDGLDEIVVEDQKSLSFQIINKIKTQLVTTTRLWLTIRKHMVQKMENQLHIMGCTLSPFSIKDQANYLVSRWTHKQLKKNTEINMEGAEIQNKFRTFAHACIRNVKQGLEEGKESFSNGGSPYGAVGLELAGNPLQCRLIASNYFGKALSYATSCDEKNLLSTLNEFKKTMSITELYESIVKKKLDTFLKKNHAPEDKNRFRNLYKPTENEFYTKHMVLAVQIMFPEEAEQLFNLSPEKEKQDTDSDPEFSNFGILSNVSTESFEFVHRTYAEYFVARFVVEFEEKFRGISKASHEANRKCMAEFVVKKVLSCPNCDGGFLPALWQKALLNRPYFNYPIVVYFLNDMLGNKNMKQPSKDFKTELDKAWMKDREAGAYEYWTLMRPPVFFAAILSNYLYVAKLYYEAFDKKELFRKKTKASHRDMIILAVERGDYEFVEFISEQIIGRKVKKILNSKDRTVADIFKTSKHSTSGVLAPLRPKTNPLYAALSRGDTGIVDYLMHSQGFGVNTWESLQSRHHGKNVLHVLLRDSWEDDENKIEQKLDLVDIVLTECNQNGIDLTEEEDEVGRPPILQPKAHVNLVQYLIDCRAANIFATDKSGNTLLHLLCEQEGFHHYYKYEIRPSGTKTDGNELECYSTGVILRNATNFIEYYRTLKGKDGEDEAGNLLDSREQKSLRSAYHIACNLIFIQKVIEEMNKDRKQDVPFSKRNSRGDTPLHNAVLSGNLDAIRLIVYNFKNSEIRKKLINLENNQKLSPLCLVTQSKPGFQMKIANELAHAGADIRTNNTTDPVLYGLQYGTPDVGVIRELDLLRFPNSKSVNDENDMLAALFKNCGLGLKSFNQHLDLILTDRRKMGEFVCKRGDEGKKTTLLHIAIKHLAMKYILQITDRSQLSWMITTDYVNEVDWQGNTALHLAYLLEDETKESKAKFLKENQADPYQKNLLGYTPNDYRKGISKTTIKRRQKAVIQSIKVSQEQLCI